jgi:hypothetical protein
MEAGTPPAEELSVNELELLSSMAYDEGAVTEVIRPAAILAEEAARNVLVELALRDVRNGGMWDFEPSIWRRFDRSWAGGRPGPSQLLGTIQVAYGTPTRYEITIFRATITTVGQEQGWAVESLCDEALGFGGYTLASCPRAHLQPPPQPFRL